MSSEEKTEQATPQKRKENRKEGRVARTQELGGWATVLIAGMAAPVLLREELSAWQDIMARSLAAVQDASLDVAAGLLKDAVMHVFTSLLVLGACVMVVGVAAALAQGGFLLATKQVKPSAKKLNPISGFKRIFGPQALWEGVKMIIKSALVGLLVWSAVAHLVPLVGGMVPLGATIGLVNDEAMTLLRNVALAGLVLAAVDYAVARRRMGKQTRMTKQEVKQEHKQSEGDPQLKGAIRSKQMAMARNRMIADVASADVVLVNPTHIAVALKYDPERSAPLVVARGAGAVALKIRENAAAARVPIVRDVPLARALHRSTEVGQTIPAELFAAVASVLAFVISRKASGQHGGEHRSPRLEDAVPDVLPRGRRRRFSSGPAATGR